MLKIFSDCQFFYICIDGQARRNGCTIGQVFNKDTLSCDVQDNVKDPLCRNWYNETVLDTVGAAAARRPGGTPLNTEDRQRVVVRRRKPRPPVEEQQQVSVSQSESVSFGAGPVRSSSGARPRVPPSAQVSRPRQQEAKQRVRRPPPQAQQEFVPLEEGPPRFSLDSEEAIQNFRDSNPFGPPSDEGRLTFLSTSTFRQPPAAQPANQPDFAPEPVRNFGPGPVRNFDPQAVRNFEPEVIRNQAPVRNQEPFRNQEPVRSFAAVAAVPEEPQESEEPAAFGSRFKSRRPPVLRERYCKVFKSMYNSSKV